MGCGAGKSQRPPPAIVNDSPGPPPERKIERRESEGPEVPSRKLMALKSAFAAIDLNNSGRVDGKELKGLLEKIGHEDLSDEDRSSLLQTIDTNGDNKIEFREFVEWVLSREGCNDAIANWSLNKGLSDIHQAAIAGDAEKIKSLVEAGGKVTTGDFNGVTPLHYAARVGKPAAAQVLLGYGADVSARTSDTKRQPLHAAAENGSVEMVKLLIEFKAEVNAQDGRVRTPLHWACCSSREGAAKELLDAKADLNIKSVAGYTPFAMAQDWSTTALTNMIAEAGGGR